jgi:hypothetical protein
MHLPGRPLRVGRVVLIAALLAFVPPLQPVAQAAAVDDPSDIVLVLDFSGSILTDEAVRTNFADALDGIAGRVDETADRLVAGDATVSIVRFATRAADVADCTGLRLRESPPAVARFGECLRQVAASYRTGGDAALLAAIGDDTNYVAAMEEAAAHLPADSARPAIIFFTDGRHEAAGVPVSEVIPARDRLFDDRSPFALLPVGMGVDPDDRPLLENGLANLRVTRAFERCEGGALDWPTVVFDSAAAAGQAVAVALQDVSCTFTVEPSSPPPPTPTPQPAAEVQSIRLVPADERIEILWAPPRDVEQSPVDGYQVRCRPADGGDDDWIEVDGVLTDTTTTVDGLTNGTEYACEVAAIRGGTPDPWTAAGATAAPFGRPPAPLKPSVQPLDGGARLTAAMPDGAIVDGYRWECSADGGTTWAIERSVDGSASVDIGGLTNGTDYVCRTFAGNASGESDASALSDAFRPCSGLFECNPLALPLLAGLGGLFAAFLLFGLWRWVAGRRLYVTAEVDRFAPVDLGRGPAVGLSFVRRGPYQRIVRIEPTAGRRAEVRIRYAGGERFRVEAAGGRVTAEFGRVAQVTDDRGEVHTIVLRAFDEPSQPLRRADEGDAAR